MVQKTRATWRGKRKRRKWWYKLIGRISEPSGWGIVTVPGRNTREVCTMAHGIWRHHLSLKSIEGVVPPQKRPWYLQWTQEIIFKTEMCWLNNKEKTLCHKTIPWFSGAAKLLFGRRLWLFPYESHQEILKIISRFLEKNHDPGNMKLFSSRLGFMSSLGGGNSNIVLCSHIFTPICRVSWSNLTCTYFFGWVVQPRIMVGQPNIPTPRNVWPYEGLTNHWGKTSGGG